MKPKKASGKSEIRLLSKDSNALTPHAGSNNALRAQPGRMNRTTCDREWTDLGFAEGVFLSYVPVHYIQPADTVLLL